MKKLAIIGASYLQQPLVEKCKEMGVYSICFAWEEGAVCKDLCDKFYPISTVDKDAILKVCQEEKIDGVTTIASDVATLTVCYVAEKMGLVGNPGFKFPLIVKPTDRSGSRGVEKVLDPVQLDEAISRARKESFEHKAVIEEFVTGCEISVESISYQGHHYILQITDKVTTGSPFFVELEHHQPSSLPENVKQRVREIVLCGLDALHIKYGASHAELKITEDGDIRVIEIGARMGGDFIGSDLVKLSTGYDFLKGVIDVSFGEFGEPKLTENNCSGVYFLCEETKDILPIIQNAKKYPEIVRAEVTDLVLRRIEQSADRSGYFIYQSDKKFVLNQ